jgi:hypothetical protein
MKVARWPFAVKEGNSQPIEAYHAQSLPTGIVQMSTHSKQPTVSPSSDLAARIYIDLVCRNLLVTEAAVQMKANPESLARTSFQLADAFLEVDAELKGRDAPKNQGFDMQDVDLSTWNSEKP